MTDAAEAMLEACETPLADRINSFWKLLETETVHLSVNIRQVIGRDAPDGPTVYYDCSTFNDAVAKELVRLRALPVPATVESAHPQAVDSERNSVLEKLHAFVVEHYANQDMNHMDFRVDAYVIASALEQSKEK
jgi:hypothetical protein